MGTNLVINNTLTLILNKAWQLCMHPITILLRCTLFVNAVLFCVLTGNSLTYAKTEPLDRTIAIVNNDIIMESELDNRLKQTEQQIKSRSLSPPPEELLKKQLLDQMITEDLQLQIAKKQNIHPSDQEVNGAMDTLAKQNKMTSSEFKNLLAEQGLAYADVHQQVRREVTIARIQQMAIVKSINISDQDIANYQASPEERQQREYHLAHILIATPDNASPEDIQQAEKKAETIYSQLTGSASDFGSIAIANSQGQRALEGGDLKWRKADQLPDLFVRMAERLKPGEISRPQRDPSGFHIIKLVAARSEKQHFETQYNVRHILIKPNEVRSNIEAQEMADKIYQQLEQGSSFEKLAKTYSDDSNSSHNSGDIGWVTAESLTPAFGKEMTVLPMNTYSKPFHSQYGWHIAEILGKRRQDVSKKLRQAEIREILARRKFEEELPIWIRQLRNDAYIKVML